MTHFRQRHFLTIPTKAGNQETDKMICKKRNKYYVLSVFFSLSNINSFAYIMAIVFAFLSLFSAACNDFLFSRVSRKGLPRGQFFVVVGIIWTLSFAFLPWGDECSASATWFWGCFSGLLSLVSNILLIESMRKADASLCSTLFRMNLLVVVLWATIFLKESLSLPQWIGVALAVGAILSYLPSRQAGQSSSTAHLGFILALLACLLRGGMSLTYKYGFAAGAARNGILAIDGTFWIVGGFLYSLWRDRPFQRPGWRPLCLAVLSGALVVGITFFMAAALQLGQASIVMPIANMSFIGTLLLSLLARQEKLTVKKAFAALCGAGAIILLTI